jgi:hypothetical protein
MTSAGCNRAAPGYLMWTRTVRSLRETLTPAGWRAVDLNQLPLVVNADRTIGVAVSSGDAVTGLQLPGLQPKTRYPKGAMTASAVERNGQLALFALTPEPGSFASMTTYILLWYRDGGERELRSELSRPASLGEGGKIDSWDRRILLPPVPLGDEVEVRDDDDPGEVDVYFEPRE